MTIGRLKKIEVLEEETSKHKKVITLYGKSLGLFSTYNKIRIASKKILELAYFDSAIMTLIAISTILLTLDNPLEDENGDFA